MKYILKLESKTIISKLSGVYIPYPSTNVDTMSIVSIEKKPTTYTYIFNKKVSQKSNKKHVFIEEHFTNSFFDILDELEIDISQVLVGTKQTHKILKYYFPNLIFKKELKTLYNKDYLSNSRMKPNLIRLNIDIHDIRFKVDTKTQIEFADIHIEDTWTTLRITYYPKSQLIQLTSLVSWDDEADYYILDYKQLRDDYITSKERELQKRQIK